MCPKNNFINYSLHSLSENIPFLELTANFARNKNLTYNNLEQTSKILTEIEKKRE